MPAKPVEKIKAAAYHFVFVGRDVNQIAKHFRVSTRTIQRWSETPEWSGVLETCDYKGPRAFESKHGCKTESDFKKARRIYEAKLKAGEPKHTLTRLVEQDTGINRKRVSEWARKHGWWKLMIVIF